MTYHYVVNCVRRSPTVETWVIDSTRPLGTNELIFALQGGDVMSADVRREHVSVLPQSVQHVEITDYRVDSESSR